MKKLHKWLCKDEAIALDLKPKENEKGRKNSRYYVTPEDWETVVLNRITPNKREFVEVIKKLDKNGQITSSTEKLQSEPIEVPDDFELVKISTSVTTGQQWTQYQPKKLEKGEIEPHNYIKVRDSIIEEMKLYSPVYPKIKYPNNKESHCLVFDPSDIHIGKIA